MKIFITGITGSGGSYLAEFLLKKDSTLNIAGSSRQLNAANHPFLKKIKDKIRIFNCDLCDFGSFFRVLNKERPDAIYHIASIANVKESFDNPISFINNNINLTLNLLEIVRTLKEIDGYNPKIIICSTSEVYGVVEEKDNPISEKNALNPVNPYASSKLSQDSLSYVYQESFGLNIIRTRMFSYFNAKRKDLFSSSFAIQALEIKNGKRSTLLHGNLNSRRTFLDIRDAMESYWLCFTTAKNKNVYNIGGNHIISVGGFIDVLGEKLEIKIQKELSQSLVRPVDITLQIPDCTKFKNDTGWSAKYGIDDSINYFLEEIKEYHF